MALGKTVLSLNKDWKFQKYSDLKIAPADNDFDMFSGYTKTGAVLGPASDGFCDSKWETVQLPHDWLVYEPFDENGCQGSKPRGVAWYRKSFFIPSEFNGKRIFIKFDGISTKSEIFLNSIRLTKSESAYTEIFAEITELIHYGQPNQLSVCTDNFSSEGWWYDGCGIYRNTWLIITENTKFKNNGIFISSKRADFKSFDLFIKAEVENAKEEQTLEIEALGQKVSCGAKKENLLTLNIENPPLWSFDSPELINISVSLFDCEHNKIDTENIKFGFREITFDTENGCILNGKRVKLKGVCLHHDHAGTGTALTYEIQLYRLKKLKEMGCNAIRTSHNPQSPEFYRACDELGFAVMDEIRHFGSCDEELRQLRSMVRRDRNHPCVFIWSIFNEEPLQCSKTGEKIALRMKRLINEEDGTRPITGGMNGPLESDGAVKVIDIMGFNYLQYGYDDFHKLNPNMPIIGSETVSHLTQRDSDTEGKTETALRRTSFGRERTNDCGGFKNLYKWSDTTGAAWKKINERKYVVGGFMWTGIDYRGEATWPNIIADFGAMDICCFEKDNYYWNQALWCEEENILNAARYRFDEKNDIIFCYTNAKAFEIIESGNIKAVTDYNIYDPKPYKVPKNSEISVLGHFKDGKEKSAVLKPEITPRKLIITCENENVKENGLAIFNISMTDALGNKCKTAENYISYYVTGGEIAGAGNGDTCCHLPINTNEFRLFHGRAQIIARAKNTGELKLCVKCGNLSEEIAVRVEKGDFEYAESVKPWIRIYPWRMSDISEVYPERELLHNMMYNWIPTMAGSEKSEMMSSKLGYASFSGNFTAPDKECEINITETSGIFDLYLNGEKILISEDDKPRSYKTEIPKKHLNRRCGLTFVFKCCGKDIKIGDVYITCK